MSNVTNCGLFSSFRVCECGYVCERERAMEGNRLWEREGETEV